MSNDTVGIMGHCVPEYKQERTESEVKRKNGQRSGPLIPAEEPSEGPHERTGKIHSFSRTLAREIQAKKEKANQASGGKRANHAAHEAIVLKYLASWSTGSKRPDRAFYKTIEEIAERYPYIKNATIGELVHTLEELEYIQVIRSGRNRRKGDRTLWYTVPEWFRHAAEEDLVYFNADTAGDIGVPASVVLFNFEHWSNQSLENDGDGSVMMSPAFLSEYFPFSLNTIKRALQDLTASYLKKESCTKPVYGPRAGVPIGSNPEMVGSYPEMLSPNPEMVGSYPEMLSPNPEMVGSYPDDVTSYKPVSNQFEDSSKKKPPASSFSLCEEMHNDAIPSSASSEPLRGTDSAVPPVLPPALENIWSAITDSNTLHEWNKDLWKKHSSSLSAERKSKVLENIEQLSFAFIATVPPATLAEWYPTKDLQALFETVNSTFRSWVVRSRETVPAVQNFVACLNTLECVLGAFLYNLALRTPRGSYDHGISELTSACYRILMHVTRVVDDEFAHQDREWIDGQRNEHASADREKEDETALSPAQKSRIFRNAVKERNRAGWIFWDGTHLTDQISMGKKGLRNIKQLFALNPELTPAMLLKVVDKGMEEFRSRPMPKEHEGDIYHRFQSIVEVCYFVRALERLVQYYGFTAEFPGTVFLGSEWESVVEGESEEVAA